MAVVRAVEERRAKERAARLVAAWEAATTVAAAPAVGFPGRAGRAAGAARKVAPCAQAAMEDGPEAAVEEERATAVAATATAVVAGVAATAAATATAVADWEGREVTAAAKGCDRSSTGRGPDS